MGLQYLLPILEWGPRYSLELLKHDFVAGAVTSIAIPQGIGYAQLANLPPTIGLYSSVVSPLVYAVMGSSTELVVAPAAVVSLLTGAMLGAKVNANENPTLYLHLAFTATLFAGIFQAFFGCLEIGQVSPGLNPLSITHMVFVSPYILTAVKIGIVTGIICLARGIVVCKSFAMSKNYHIDANKEMIAFGMMNILGSFTSCYPTSGSLSQSAAKVNAGGRTAASNIVMALAILFTLVFLTPRFQYTPIAVLSSILMATIMGIVDYEAAIHMWRVDKLEFVVCMVAYIGLVFGSIEIGLVIVLGLSLPRLLFLVSRPRIAVLGNIPDSVIHRSIDQYPNAINVPRILIPEISSPIFFANSCYLRERILRWIAEEQDNLKSEEKPSLRFLILDMGAAVDNIDTSGINMFEELKKNTDIKGLKLFLANPRGEVIEKLNKSKLIEAIGQKRIYLTVGDAVEACNSMLYASKPKQLAIESDYSLISEMFELPILELEESECTSVEIYYE
ncbi:hypothetical protein RHSIM_Rhsim13G0027800 [Rhododendron simsii]|uniref:STAS domain-containing protein n=1 Tax=Rhododendron simsii TaxID=118357 RepID=A0A834L6V2_RHOSS|nr:hypothetical protein RHSIM_Rhsim13G0027800 [Rhododendron simsii]